MCLEEGPHAVLAERMAACEHHWLVQQLMAQWALPVPAFHGAGWRVPALCLSRVWSFVERRSEANSSAAKRFTSSLTDPDTTYRHSSTHSLWKCHVFAVIR